MNTPYTESQHSISIQLEAQIDLVEKIANILRDKFLEALKVPFNDPSSELSLKQRVDFALKLNKIIGLISSCRSLNSKILVHAILSKNTQEENGNEHWEKIKKYVKKRVNEILIKYGYSDLIEQIKHYDIDPVYTKDFRLPKPT